MQGINKHLTKATNATACTLLCLAGGYLLAGLAADSTIYNADAAAPYYQAKLISTGTTLDPKVLSFARIPSIFPDLATLIALTGLDKFADFHDIFARYSLVIACLFIFLQSEVSRLSLSCRISRAKSLLIATFITIFLTSISPQFKNAIGILLTPLHHGGNIIGTYLVGCLLLWNQGPRTSPNATHLSIKLLLTCILISLGVASNKLLIFTGLAPAGLAMIATAPLILKPKQLEIDTKFTSKYGKLAIVFAASLLAGIAAPVLLNTQCPLSIVIRPLYTYKQFFEILSYSPIYVVGLLAAVALTFYSGRLLNGSSESRLRTAPPICSTHSSKNLFLGSAFLSISSISPLFYIWALGEPQHLPLRYLIIISAGISCALTIAASLLLMKSELPNANRALLRASKLTIPALITFELWTGFSVYRTSHRIEDVYTREFRSRSHKKDQIIKQLDELELTQGLSDFWGSELGFISDLSDLDNKDLSVEPILSNGKPDLWAHSKLQFRNAQGRIKDYQFVITTKGEFENGILEAFGPPSQKLPTAIQDKSILLYNNTGTRKKINRLISKKLRAFSRQCNPEKADFSDR